MGWYSKRNLNYFHPKFSSLRDREPLLLDWRLLDHYWSIALNHPWFRCVFRQQIPVSGSDKRSWWSDWLRRTKSSWVANDPKVEEQEYERIRKKKFHCEHLRKLALDPQIRNQDQRAWERGQKAQRGEKRNGWEN